MEEEDWLLLDALVTICLPFFVVVTVITFILAGIFHGED